MFAGSPRGLLQKHRHLRIRRCSINSLLVGRCPLNHPKMGIIMQRDEQQTAHDADTKHNDQCGAFKRTVHHDETKIKANDHQP